MSIKISQLSSSTSVTGSDLIVTVTPGANSSLITAKSTIQQVFNYVTSTITDLTLDNLTVLDNAILGNSATDSLTVNATSHFNSDLTASNILINNDLIISGEISGTNLQITSLTGATALFSGDVSIQGKLTALEYYSETISASVIFESGSTKFGNDSFDIHQFTGSLLIEGDISSSGNITAAQKLTATNIDALGSVDIKDNLYVTGNLTVNGGNIISSAGTLNINAAGSVNIQDNLFITGNLNTSGNLSVNGGNITSTASTLNINAGGTINIQDDVFITGNLNTSGNLEVNSGNITSKASILTITAGDRVRINDPLNVTGNITAHSLDLLFGNITTQASSLNIYDSVTITGSLSVSGLISSSNSIIAAGSITANNGNITANNLTLNAGSITSPQTITINSAGLLKIQDNISVTGGIDLTSNIQTAGDLAVNGGDITSTQSVLKINSGKTVSGTIAQFESITASFSGDGTQITNLTASNIVNFTSDVRNQFSAGSNITIVDGVISSTGGGGGFTGSFSTAVNTVTGNITLDDTYHTVYAYASSSNITITLPSAATYNGIEYIIKKTDTSPVTIVTISGSGGQLIDGYEYIPLDYRFEGITIQSDGTSSWFINADVSSEITLIAQGYVNPIGSNNLYILTESLAVAGFNKSIQFNDAGVLAGADKLTYDKNTEVLSGTRVQFTVVTASVVSASQYIGLTGGGDVLSFGNNTFSGINTFNSYITATLGITGGIAKFAELTGSLYGTASNAHKLDGLESVAFAILAAQSNTFTNYITASITGSSAKFTNLSGTLHGTATNSQLLNGLSSTDFARLATVDNVFINTNTFSSSANQFTGSLFGTATFASNSDLLGGIDSTDFARISVANVFNSTNQFDSFYITATVGITGSDAKFTNITATLLGTASYANNADLLDGLDSTAFALLSSTSNTFANYVTASITGSEAKFTVISASIISASQYFGIIGGGSSNPAGPNQSIQFNSGSQLSGSSNLIYNYYTNILSGTVAQFTQLTSSNISGRLINLTTHVSTVTANVALSSDSHVILGSASVSNIILTLPSASVSSFRQYVIKKIDPTAFKIIISGSGTEKIDGATGRQIGTQYETITLISDGASQWFIL